MISAIVLAAGISQRMGARNKLLLPVGRNVLVRHVLERVCAAKVDETIVVLGHESEGVGAALAELDVHAVHNPRYAEGMATSMHTGVRAASPHITAFMIVLADMPLLETDDYNLLIEAFLNAQQRYPTPIIVPTHENHWGNPVLFASDFRDDLLRHEGPCGGKAIIRHRADAIVHVPMPNDHILHDMDTDEAYHRLLQVLG